MYATSGKSRACASSQLHNGRVPPYMPQIDADVEAQDVGSMHALLVTLLNQQQLMQLQLNQFVMMQEQSNKKTTGDEAMAKKLQEYGVIPSTITCKCNKTLEDLVWKGALNPATHLASPRAGL